MRKISQLLILMVCIGVAGLPAGVIVPGLDDSTALADYSAARAGTTTDTVENATGLLTLAARFNPDASQMTGGPFIVIEIGGTSNGTGLYLGDGNLIFACKNNNQLGLPASMNDMNFSDNALALTLGPVVFGVENKVYISMNLNTGEFISSINGITTLHTITNSTGSENLDGNHSVSFLGLDALVPGHMGGLVETGAAQFPLLFWNNAANMTQTAGYNNQRGQVFAAFVNLALLPHNPVPATGAKNVDPSKVTQLKFDTAKNPGNPGSQNPNVTGHFVTVFQVQNGEPNLLLPPLFETFAEAGPDPISVPYTFDLDEAVYWRVEEQILNGSKGDPNNIIGPVWFFEALSSVPVVTASPVDAAVFPAEQVSFTCEFTSKSELTAIKWYRSSNPNVPISDADADITITLDQDGNDYTSTLTIDNVEPGDEDSYWCYVQNSAGEDTSDTVDLAVKRQVAHWTLDETDLVGGQYLDISGEGHHADPNIIPGSASFVDGADPAETGDGLDFKVEPLVAADSGNWAPSLYTGEVSVSAWLNWAGSNGTWQGVVSNRSAVGAANANFYIEIRQDNGNLQIGGIPGAGDVQVAPLPIGQWAHMAITARAGEVVIYINGQARNTNTSAQSVLRNIVPVRIGALNRSAEGQLLSTFNGVMDDVQIFNYTLSNTQVVDLYYAVLETPVCVNPLGLDLGFDVAGGGPLGNDPDCQVNLADFAAFAATWLNCGLYPAVECL
jgi:hypothetical protein